MAIQSTDENLRLTSNAPDKMDYSFWRAFVSNGDGTQSRVRCQKSKEFSIPEYSLSFVFTQ